MRKLSLASQASLALVAIPVAAEAQWVPGSEIVGQTLRVETGGITNSVRFDLGGAAQIASPGGRVINASWTSGNGQLCLLTGNGRECWPYQTAFQAGQPLVLTSSCNSSSRWIANAVNQLPPPPPPPPQGERG